jgi:hypothetical protein
MEKRYARTINEAFPNTMEYGACIEIQVPRLTTADKAIRVIAIIALIVLALDIFFWRI